MRRLPHRKIACPPKYFYWLINNSTLRLITYVNISFEPFDIDLSNALIIIAIGDILTFLCLIELFSCKNSTGMDMFYRHIHEIRPPYG